MCALRKKIQTNKNNLTNEAHNLTKAKTKTDCDYGQASKNTKCGLVLIPNLNQKVIEPWLNKWFFFRFLLIVYCGYR